jgi:hypothetical protein
MSDCQLCRAVLGFGDEEFTRRYPMAPPRLVRLADERVALMPSVGSLGQLHALVLPTEHARSTAGVAAHPRRALWAAVTRLRTQLARSGGSSVVFEHGLPPRGGRGCGVDHAHAHVVTIPPGVGLAAPAGAWSDDPFGPPDLQLDPAREHLLLGLPSGIWLSRYEDGVESQFLRKWLASQLGHDSWDWRFAGPEENLPRRAQHLRALFAARAA